MKFRTDQSGRPVQVFLQGKLLGIEAFVQRGSGDAEIAGRCLYLSLLMEVMPRAILRQLGLAPELLGVSGGGRFLMVLPAESMPEASEILTLANAKLQALSGGSLHLAWWSTENLGVWPDIRKRLAEEMNKAVKNRLSPEVGSFAPRQAGSGKGATFAGEFLNSIRSAKTAGWDPESDYLIRLDGGTAVWHLGHDAQDGLPVALHTAPDEEGESVADLATLGRRASGRKTWGILRGDVDGFAARLRKAETIEEHIKISVFFKQFFAGELQVACSMKDFWQKVSILYTGADDFAVVGSWDALVPLAREIQRLFHRSAEEFLQEFAGPEAKTLSMAIALAPSAESPLGPSWAEAGRLLETAKSTAKDSIHLFGGTLEWKQLTELVELKDIMVRLATSRGGSRDFIGQLAGFYRVSGHGYTVRASRQKADRFDRPWRFYRRLNSSLDPESRDREFQKARAALLGQFIARNQAHVRLRPTGRVALEWTRLILEAESA